MTEVQARFAKCTVVSIAAVASASSETAALAIAKRFGSTCRAILVTNEDLVVSARVTFGHVLDVVTGQWRDLRQVVDVPGPPTGRGNKSSTSRIWQDRWALRPTSPCLKPGRRLPT